MEAEVGFGEVVVGAGLVSERKHRKTPQANTMFALTDLKSKTPDFLFRKSGVLNFVLIEIIC